MSRMDKPDFHTYPTSPGIYKMLNEAGKIIYVGKAKNLKKRVSSYFRKTGLDAKTQAMVAKIADIEVSCTETEKEALILEGNLIKRYRPKYNICFRDDKTYPYLCFSKDLCPRFYVYRGVKRSNQVYFGPYPNVSSARSMLTVLQKIFLLRDCTNAFFNHRSRPCLKYQIKRCSAPCVNEISAKDYAADVARVQAFLKGKNEQVLSDLADQMEKISDAMDFEQAAKLRDQLKA